MNCLARERALFSLAPGNASTSGGGHPETAAPHHRGLRLVHRQLPKGFQLKNLLAQTQLHSQPTTCRASGESGSQLEDLPRPAPRSVLPSPAPPSAPRMSMVKPARLSAPLITKKIKSTRSWEALQAVVDEDSHIFNHIHISAALLHLAGMLAATSLDSMDESSRPHIRQSIRRQNSRQQLAQQKQQLAGELGQGAAAPRPPPLPIPATRLHPSGAQGLLRQLLSMAQQQLEFFDVQGISNTLYSLAILRHHDHAMMEGLLAAVQYRLDTCRPQNLANIIWSCVTLSFTPVRDWMALYYDGLEQCISGFGPQDVSNTLWAFGRLEFNGAQYKVAPDIVAQLLMQAYPQLHQFSAQQLSNSLWGLARLGFAPSQYWLQGYMAASLGRMDAMHPHELSSMAWAASRLRMQASEAWLEKLMQVTEPMLPLLDTHQLTQLLLALGKLGAKPTPTYMAAVLFATQAKVHAFGPRAMVATLSGVASMGGPGVAQLPAKSTEVWVASMLEAAWPMLDQSDKSILDAAAAAISSMSMDSFDDDWAPSPLLNAQEVALMLHALVTMGIQPPTAWLQRALSCLEHGPGMMAGLASDGAATAMLLWTLPKLLQPPSTGSGAPANADHSTNGASSRTRLPSTFLSSLAAAAMPRLRRYEPLELATLMQGFAFWGYAPDRAWMARFWWRTFKLLSSRNMPAPALTMLLKALVSMRQTPHALWWKGALRASRLRFEEFEPHHFSVLLRAMSDMRYKPGSSWVRSYLLATYGRWESFQPGDWSEMLYAFAKLEVDVPREWLYRWFMVTQPQLRSLTTPQLALMAWSLAQLDVRPPRPWVTTFFKLTQPQLGCLNPGQLLRLLWASNRIMRVPPVAWIKAAAAAARALGGQYRPEQEQLMAIALQSLKTRALAAHVLAAQEAAAAEAPAAQALSANHGGGEDHTATHSSSEAASSGGGQKAAAGSTSNGKHRNGTVHEQAVLGAEQLLAGQVPEPVHGNPHSSGMNGTTGQDRIAADSIQVLAG